MDILKLGYSYPWGKPEIADFLLAKLPEKCSILDVGAGNGAYREIIGYTEANKHHISWSAVEIWPEAAEYLSGLYDKVYQEDIRKFIYPQTYDLIIFGDILEHLSVADAKKVLKRAQKHAKMILVAVPYLLPQGTLYGNEAEIHLQPDLTPEIFLERYPEFNLVHQVTKNNIPIYGYYFKEIK